MTYCVAMSLDAGMIFASDSRTNAGVDQIARFSKMNVFAREGQRVDRHAVVRQPVDHAERDQHPREARRAAATTSCNLWNAESMFDVARLLGDALREVKTRDGPYLVQNNIDAQRQLHRRRPDPRRAAAPVQRLRRRQLHRGHARHLLLPDRRDQVRQADHRSRDQAHDERCSTRPSARSSRSTRRCAPTSRSGLPIDLLVYETDSLRIKLQRRIEEIDPYFQMVHTQWGEGLRRVFAQLPDPDWT